MPVRLRCILFATLLVAVTSIAVPAFADETYLVHGDFQRYNSNIVIHLLQVNVTDNYMGNIYPSKAPQDTKWAHLVYQYENTGDQMEVGNIQYELIDSRGRVYKFNPNQDEYSGVEVQPHSKSDIRWNEIPIPKDAVLTKVHVFEGTNPSLLLANETYDLQAFGTPTPTVVPSTPVPSIYRFGCCSPLLPFILIGSLAIVGIYTKGRSIKK
ncbi:MAG TPA: hypothetical protein VMC84_12445 [Methanocella sp.]|uniref:hypothetical protein n=1 Tax=Methanocella sp. TaxID=2052833 RepID=UPI002C2FF967|nr:hypothetical protein [Methanocella sp.]HTY91977.1 hypothetical protein [Methanocella sp.]